MEGLRWTARSEIPVAVSGPHGLAVNLAAQPGKRCVLVHLVNDAGGGERSAGPLR